MHMKKERRYGIDLLKIILAFMVLTLHFNAGATGQVLQHATIFPWNILVQVVTLLCYPAVNCYVLISGYFMYKYQKNIAESILSVICLWLSVIFFSIIGYIIVILAFHKSFDFIVFIKHLFPVCRGKWWFITVYVVMALLSPFLNTIINNITMKQFRILLGILLVSSSVVPMFLGWDGQLGSGMGYSLFWFITLYFVGAYIHNNYIVQPSSKKSTIFLCAVIYILVDVVIMMIEKVFMICGIKILLTPYNSIFILVQACALVILFLNTQINKKCGGIIAKIASLSMASYLFHCQEDLDTAIWEYIKPWQYANSSRILIVYLLTIVFLYVIAILIEQVRNTIFGKIESSIFLIDKLRKYVEDILSEK